MKSFKICQIGCGGMSVRGHGPALMKYAAEHAGTILAGCCDLNEAKAKEFKNAFGFQKTYIHWRKMLDEISPDAVSMAVPVKFTADIASEIIRLGFNLITEKPPGMTVWECSEILQAIEKSDARALAAFNRRYMPLIKKLVSMIGDTIPEHIRYDFFRTGRKDADFSTTAIHGIDTVKMMAASDYKTININYQPLESTPVGNIFLSGEMKAGTTVSINFYPDSGLTAERVTVISGGKTWFLSIPIWECPDYPGKILCYLNGELIEEINGKETDKFISSGFYDEHRDFYEAVRNGKPVPHEIADSMQSVHIMEFIRNKKKYFSNKT